MVNQEALSIVSADRLQDSIIVGFSDGRCGRYSAVLLHSILAQSEELFESDWPEEADNSEDK